ncbi:MAG TPA: ABC transporter permease [Puia sp.]|jgi:ABC-2 type transport system permease protein|nr:ABC transporter permease [Puia sp.]
MIPSYNQFRAMLAISKASFRAILRSPSAVVFSFGFPLIFILVFGFIGGSGITVRMGLKNEADTGNYAIMALLKNPLMKLVREDSTAMRNDLGKGRIAAIISIDSTRSAIGFWQYRITPLTSEASMDKYPILRSFLAESIQRVEQYGKGASFTPFIINEVKPVQGREYTMIDFILPGMLGFSLLSAGIFGVAFLFFNLRQMLVLKRFFATPINRKYIVLGEALSRVLFQLLTAIVIILVGHFVFKFTLVNGIQTFLEMILLSFFGLIVFMGFGFIISSVSKNESSIPPFANLITLPQFLLGGTFFSTDAFPSWLQKFCEILPLKQLNDAMRNVAFEGAHITDCGKQLGILGLWGIIVYAIAFKVFKWE